jgi:hypothetical protein
VGHPAPPAWRPLAPADLAVEIFTCTTLSPELRAELRQHLEGIEPSRVRAYARSLLALTAHPRLRVHPMALFDDLLAAVVAQQSADPEALVRMALDVIAPTDEQLGRLMLVDALGTLSPAVVQRWPELKGYLDLIDSHTVRCMLLRRLSSWEEIFGSTLPGYLQALEPLLPDLTEQDLDALEHWLEPPSDGAGRPITGQDTVPLTERTYCDLYGLSEAEVETMVYEHDYSEEWQVLHPPPNAKVDLENVMRAPRHFTTHAAVGLLLREVDPMPPYLAVATIVDRFLVRARHCPQMQKAYGLTPIKLELASSTWKRPSFTWDAVEPLVANQDVTYLADYSMPMLQFVALTWYAMQRYRQGEGTWAGSARQRHCMRTSYIDALARLQRPLEPHESAPSRTNRVPPPDSEGRRTARRCHVGVTQELVSCLMGYYLFNLEQVTPGELLSDLAQKAFGSDESDDAPDVERLAAFADYARERAKAIFGNQKPVKPGAMTEEEKFLNLLHDYLNYDFSFDTTLRPA